MKYQAVLFDFDYTLGDATPSIYEGFCHAFEHMGLPQPGLDQVRQTVGHTLQDAYTMLTGDADAQRREECRKWFHEKVRGRQAAMTLLLPGPSMMPGSRRASSPASTRPPSTKFWTAMI